MLEASDREIYPIDIVPTPSSRRPFGEYTTTLAMHWDGTYRDHYAGSRHLFWEDYRRDDYSEEVLPARDIAKHLA